MKSDNIQEKDFEHRIFLSLFYVSAFIVVAIVSIGIYFTLYDWFTKGSFVIGEVLVKTEFPTPHFSKLVTWLYFSSIISWYCFTRIKWKKTVQFSNLQRILIRVSLSGFVLICLYGSIYNFTHLESQITAGIRNGIVPDIDSLTTSYVDHGISWNLTFAAKMFLSCLIISSHALYLSMKSGKQN